MIVVERNRGSVISEEVSQKESKIQSRVCFVCSCSENSCSSNSVVYRMRSHCTQQLIQEM